jgi:hypothetical protein
VSIIWSLSVTDAPASSKNFTASCCMLRLAANRAEPQ